MIRAMKNALVLLLLLSTSLNCKARASFPLTTAHWRSPNEILFFETAGIPLPAQPHFVLNCDELPLQIELPVISHDQNRWTLSAQEVFPKMQDILRSSAWIQVQNDQRQTMVQSPLRFTGLLDSEMSDASVKLGPQWSMGEPFLRVWSPTAQKVSVLLYDSPNSTNPQVISLNREPKGFWSVRGDTSWKNKYYLYQVFGFSPYLGQTSSSNVVDPYAPNLSTDRHFGQLVDMNDPELMPANWIQLKKPRLARVKDSVVYEIHLRDFTANDPNLPSQLKGTYLGIADPRSSGFSHLKDLAKAGLTHVHFLPLMAFSSVPENASTIIQDPLPGSSLDPSSPDPQNQLSKIRNTDPYNWGYDPSFWFAPQGSYSSQADGTARILEMRSMVQTMNNSGLRVIMDVVYNHSAAAGFETDSNLDQLVPYYYHRYDQQGNMQKSSCCNDMATETVMMEKLITDSLVFWATNYRIDGFRFDLLNMHPKAQVVRLKQALQSLTPAQNGVDGSKILIYGEAWNFGSLEQLQPGSAFTQLNSYGVGVGVFNDRLRDALRGGTTNDQAKSDQGFATGLFYDFNEEPANANTSTNLNEQRDELLLLGDVVKIGIAGNLRDFKIRDRYNNQVAGGNFYFRNSPVGYAAAPGETITYASSHDGYSLFDSIQAKLPYFSAHRFPRAATEDDRVRTQKLILGTILLSQGIPFFEGGSDLLRSKSGDQDSYDSGDWFNAIDWSLNSNNWGTGLPPAWSNQQDWSFWKPRLDASNLNISRASILSTTNYFQAFLKIRKSSPLFSMENSSDISSRLAFPADEKTNGDIPGLVVFSLQNQDLKIDPARKSVWVFINASNQLQSYQNSTLMGLNLKLHSELNTTIDPELSQATWSTQSGLVQIPSRSILVLEQTK